MIAKKQREILGLTSKDLNALRSSSGHGTTIYSYTMHLRTCVQYVRTWRSRVNKFKSHKSDDFFTWEYVLYCTLHVIKTSLTRKSSTSALAFSAMYVRSSTLYVKLAPESDH